MVRSDIEKVKMKREKAEESFKIMERVKGNYRWEEEMKKKPNQ